VIDLLLAAAICILIGSFTPIWWTLGIAFFGWIDANRDQAAERAATHRFVRTMERHTSLRTLAWCRCERQRAREIQAQYARNRARLKPGDIL
jgi:hypothetical protein